MTMKRIETERLILRPHTIEDILPAYEMNLDTEVSKYTGDGGVVSLSEIERRIKEDVMGDYAKYGFGRFAVELKSKNKFIGFAGLKYLEDLDEVDLGYRLMSEYWGKGYATEASRACVKFGFEVLELDRVIALVMPDNEASINVLLKLGFKFDTFIEEDGEQVKKYSLEKQPLKAK